MNSKGFSLLELIVVMAIIGFIAFLVPPLMTGTIERLEVRTAAKNIATSLRYAKTRAIAEKIPLRFSIDSKENTYWLSSGDIKENSEKAEDLRLNIKRAVSKDIEIKGAKMSKGYYSNSESSGSAFTVNFFPNGNSSGGKITVRRKIKKDKNTDENRFDIYIDVFTGGVEVTRPE